MQQKLQFVPTMYALNEKFQTKTTCESSVGFLPCSVVFDFTTNEEIPAGYSNGRFLIVETGGANNSRGAYVALMNKTTGEVYPVRIATTGKNIEFYCDKTIPSGVALCGSVTFDCNPTSSAET